MTMPNERARTVKIEQSDRGRWAIWSQDQEQVLSWHPTARHAAIAAIDNYLGPLQTLTLEFTAFPALTAAADEEVTPSPPQG